VGNTSVSLGDLEALQAKEVRSVPLSYWELEKNFGGLPQHHGRGAQCNTSSHWGVSGDVTLTSKWAPR
jgi:hypothetical protein